MKVKYVIKLTSKKGQQKKKIKWNCIKVESFCTTEKIICFWLWSKKATYWMGENANNISVNGIIFKLYKELRQLNSSKQTIQFKIWQKTKIMAAGPITSWEIDGKTVKTVRLYFLGLQNHCRWWLQSWNQKTLTTWKKSYDQPRPHFKKAEIIEIIATWFYN